MPAKKFDERQKPSMPARRLTFAELTFLKLILNRENDLLRGLEDVLVEDMADDRMGSLLFVGQKERERKLGRSVVEAEFRDRDGVLVSVRVNLDDGGRLFELDIWKVDFSPLLKFPDERDIVIKAVKSV